MKIFSLKYIGCYYKRILLLFITLIFSAIETTHAQKYNFISFSVENGLSQSEVNVIYQDSRGYLWVGTSGGGLCKFDGKEFTTYDEQNGLSGQIVGSIAESKNGDLWIGTTWGGICRFNGKKIITYDVANGLSDNLVNCILVSKEGKIYAGTGNGVNYYKDNKFFKLSVKNQDPTHVIVMSLVQDKFGTIWAATNEGLMIVTKNGLVKYYDEKNLFLSDLVLLNDSSILMLTNKGEIRNCSLLEKEKLGLKETSLILPDLQEDDKPIKIYLDKQKRLWIATHESGIYVIDKKNIFHYTKNNGLPTNYILSFHQDKSGCMWLGSRGHGLIKFQDKSFTYYDNVDGLKSEDIFSILFDKQGNQWIGSLSEGVFKKNGERIAKIGKDLPLQKTRNISELSSGKVIISGSKGLRIWDGKKLKDFLPVKEESKIKGSITFEDKEKQLWIGTFGQGLYLYNGSNIHHFTGADGFSPKYVYTILQYVNGDIWIGTEGGAYIYSKGIFKHIGTEEGLCNLFVGSMTQDNNGNIYLGTDKCVARYDGRKTRVYSALDGLSSSTVYLLHCDKKGNLYVGTNKGFDLISFNKDGDIIKLKRYGFNEGFKGVECNSRAVAEDSIGNIWFGTIKGLIKFSPQENAVSEGKNNGMQITAFRINYKDIDYDNSEAEYSKWFHLPLNPQIPFTNERITFEFAYINPSNPQKLNYSFKLEGYDKQWSPWGNINIASYSNLKSGNYIFKVKSINNNGEASKEVAYPFVIKTPYYATWWFALSVISVLAYLSYFIIELRRKKEAKDREKLELIIAQRTSEIQKRNEEKEVLLKEVHHRVKNNLQVINSLINIQSSYIEDEKALHIFEECKNRIRTISLIHEKLYKSNDFKKINFNDYLVLLIQDLVQTYNINKQIELKTDLQIEFFNLNTIVPLGLLLNEIISNSLKYAFIEVDKGEINISLIEMPLKRYQLIISDNGVGYEGDPNRPSKNSLGLELIKILSEQLDGVITKLKLPGTVYQLEFSLQKN